MMVEVAGIEPASDNVKLITELRVSYIVLTSLLFKQTARNKLLSCPAHGIYPSSALGKNTTLRRYSGHGLAALKSLCSALSAQVKYKIYFFSSTFSPPSCASAPSISNPGVVTIVPVGK